MQLQYNLLQIVGSTKKLGYGNDIDYRGFTPKNVRWERHNKMTNENGEICDYDSWGTRYVIKQISSGLNSCPLLYSCLFGEYVYLDSYGQLLVDHRDAFRSKKLIDGCLRFCDRKIKQSKTSKQKHHVGKYIYYAISDISEQIEILKTNNCIYPLQLDYLDLLIDLKNNKNIDQGYKKYNELVIELKNINLPNKVDEKKIKWLLEHLET